MVTQCAACGVWFRVSEESLQAVHGLVRCGNCGTVFNALGTLRPAPPQAGDTRGGEGEDGADEAAAETLAWAGPAPLPAAPQKSAFRWVWRAAAGVLLVALAAQLAHAGRRTLARWPLIGPAVAAAYRAAGRPLAPEPELAYYEIGNAALAAAGNSGSTLELKGLLINRARSAQPLPLVDLKLMDRYGETVATRLLAPGDYGAGSRTELGPNLSIAFNVKLADPGAIAVGFALTVCKHTDAGAVRCRPF